MIAYFATDLVWASRIKMAGEDAGIACRPTRTVEMLDARLADSDVRALIVDLDDPATALELVRHARARRTDPPGPLPGSPEAHPIRILAFGPHVDAEAFARAVEAGADRTMTRGQFHASLVRTLQELDG